MTLSPAEEQLEKQYQDYKAQFEQWKERNRESIGTDAYVKYVNQFEDWEKDVERRRTSLRQKTETERLAAENKAMELVRQESEKQEQAKKVRQAPERHDAILIREIEQQEMESCKMEKYDSPFRNETHKIKPELELNEMRSMQQANEIDNSMVTVMQQMLNFVTEKSSTIEADTKGSTPVVNPMMPQQIPPPQDSATPQLWGTEGSTYLTTDAMFKRWNVRAAPPNFRVPYQPPPLNAMISPCWLMIKKMQEKNLGLFTPQPQQFNLPPSSLSIPGAAIAPPLNMNVAPTIFNKIL